MKPQFPLWAVSLACGDHTIKTSHIAKPSVAILVAMALGLASCPVFAGNAATLAGKVVYVDDGDTVIVLVDGKTQEKVRLSSIDAPESSHTNKEKGRIGQPYSNNSGQYLASLIKGKNVELSCFEPDRYGRNVCEVFFDGKSVNKEMVKQGWAWANMSGGGRYLRDKSLPGLEAQARANRSGLWAGTNPVAPWEWRDTCWKQGRCSQ
jgi:endonuclease YncB( thermonuclease family)